MTFAAGLRRLKRDTSGVALTEFAFVAPLVLAVGMYGTEMSKLALARMQLSQIAMQTADTLSRVGLDSGLSQTQLTEANVNDAIAGARIASAGLGLTTNGRIIISSLQTNSAGGQWISWQRCKGLKNVGSAYGTAGTGATGTAFLGMGPATARVTSTAANPVIYVEINYDYQPLYPFLWSSAPTGKTLQSIFNSSQRVVTYGNAYMVRDNRDQDAADQNGNLVGITNPNSPLTGQLAPQSLCTALSAT